MNVPSTLSAQMALISHLVNSTNIESWIPASRIFPTLVKPVGIKNPSLSVVLIPIGVLGENFIGMDCNLLLTIYLDKLTSGDPELRRLTKLEKEIDAALEGKTIVSSQFGIRIVGITRLEAASFATFGSPEEEEIGYQIPYTCGITV